MVRHISEGAGSGEQGTGKAKLRTLFSGSRLSTLDSRPTPRGITLVEMLIAMAITLIMMGAVVTLFANVSNSVRNRRAVIEMSGQLRHVRNVLQGDLEGATCPGLTWQRPEHNRGYIEIIEGSNHDMNPSMLTDGFNNPDDPELDPKLSFVPRNNLIMKDYDNDGEIGDGEDIRMHLQDEDSLFVNGQGVNGLGDADDVLMLTVRNEHEPFVGRVPAKVRLNANNAEPFDVDDATDAWSYDSVESPLAEVVWYAIENPVKDADGDGKNDTGNFFGEPGMRTIYRRTLLIAPWLNPYRYTDPNNGAVTDTFNYDGGNFVAQPGLLRILPDRVDEANVDQALAGLIAFQDRYDVSARIEFDPRLGSDGRWKIVANTLGDLTKRENRYEHYGYRPVAGKGRTTGREFPYAAESVGFDYTGTQADVAFVPDPEVAAATGLPSQNAQAWAYLVKLLTLSEKFVLSYAVDPLNLTNPQRRYASRPLAYVDQESVMVATARAMLNDDGAVIRVVHGLVPLWGDRRGEDVMLTNALAFDLRVYDPGAPLYLHAATGTVLEPSDPGWSIARRRYRRSQFWVRRPGGLR
jgi:Prokaryotic N-terminal methylation motif